MISNTTDNPVAVYECAVPDPNKTSNYVVGALAYEQNAWRCMYFDPSSDTNLSSVGPGTYQVYTDSSGDAHGAEATSEKPFPSKAIQPLFSSYKYATGCQTTYAEVIGGFPYYFPAYGTAIPDENGNFVCHGASFRLHAEGRYVTGGLPYNIAVES